MGDRPATTRARLPTVGNPGGKPGDARVAGNVLPLARSDLDRTAHRREDAAWLASAWADERTRVLVVAEGQALVAERAAGSAGSAGSDGSDGSDGSAAADVQLVLVRPDDPTVAADAPRYLLGTDDDGIAYFAVPGTLEPPADPSVRLANLREVGALLDDRDAGLLAHALALDAWHQAHPRCPRCGAATEVSAAGHQRRCPADGSQHFPRTDPAVIMLVTDGVDRCLLGRQVSWPEGRFSTLAGFVEPGESLEQAVAREVDEEVGLTVVETCYVASQPWPFPASLMLGFVAQVSDVELRPDGVEVAEARWFTRAELERAIAAREVRPAPRLSIARCLIEGWYGGPLPDPPRGEAGGG